MAEADGLFIFMGAYDSVDEAKEDFEAIKVLRAEKFVGRYEAALFQKTVDGDVKVLDTDVTERAAGAKAGLVAGAVIGVFFPVSLIALAGTGAGVGALVSNVSRVMKRHDIKEMGEALDAGQAAVVIVAETTVEAGVENLMKKASKIMKKEIDAQADDMKAAIDGVMT